MKARDLLLVFAGIAAAGLVFTGYALVKGPARAGGPGPEPVPANDEISKQRLNAIVVAAGRVGPAVVSITVVQTRIVTVTPFGDPFFDEFFGDFFPERRYRQEIKSLGSGVIISSDGYVLTNEHVVHDASKIRITLSSGVQHDAAVVAADTTSDLALLKVNGVDLPYAELGNSGDLMIGEWVIALGNPFGFLLEDTRPTVTVGVISALGRSIKSTYQNRLYRDMIQTDAAINPGNSGGPLTNILGQVVGINTFIFTASGGSEGIGFARPVNFVKKFIDEAKRNGATSMRPAAGAGAEAVACAGGR